MSTGVDARRRLVRSAVAALGGIALAMPSPAYLFWAQPKLKGERVKGDEPGITVSLQGANPKEVSANLLWAMRAGLNVAALQCQFAPALMTLPMYNQFLKLHQGELATAYSSISSYFKRTGGKKWQTALDQYTTQTYNGFSTLTGQLEFCETAASIGREAAATPPGPGKLGEIAETRMREFRNSLSHTGDAALAYQYLPCTLPDQQMDIGCFNKKGKPIPCRN